MPKPLANEGQEVDALIQTFRNLGMTRLAIMAGVFVGFIAFFIFIISRVATPDMSLLYGQLDSAEASRIGNELDTMGVVYEMRNNGTEIMVPSGDARSLRLRLAEQGLPSKGTIGYEIFDEGSSIGTTNLVQTINNRRALEGELSRTISSLNIVRSARVHLVLPDRKLFSREHTEPSASVLLRMAGPGRLDREQVAAVQHIIAAAVPGLAPNRVSIVDGKGSLLSRGFEDATSAEAVAAKADERRRMFESRMGRRIEELIERAVGFGNVRAEVRADMDFDRVSTNEETYDPDGQVVRSTHTLEESSNSREAEPMSVSVATNLPDAGADTGEGATKASTAENRTEETVNYEISKKVTNHVRESGDINRLSVAVLVDGMRVKNNDGDVVYQPRTKEEMDQIANLVKSTIGFDAARGDAIEVINMKFTEVEEPPEEDLELFMGFNKQDLLRVVELVVLSVVGLLFILMVIRPLVARAFEALPAAAGATPEGRLLIDDVTGAPALAGPMEGEDEDEFEELINIDKVEGRVKASSVKKVGEIVDKHPGEALAIIRSWMYQD